jgi:hypothetical protein
LGLEFWLEVWGLGLRGYLGAAADLGDGGRSL